MAEADDYMLEADRELLAARFEKRRLAWEEARERGRVLYVITEALKVAGIAIFSQLAFDFLIDRARFHRDLYRYSWRVFAITFFLASFAGLWEWHRNEKRYRGKVL